MTAKLNFRRVFYLLLSALVLTFGCKDMQHEIQDLKDRLDVLEGSPINSTNEQIAAINTSISDLKEVDESLGSYIKALEGTAADLQKQIEATNAEIVKVEAGLGEKISELTTAKEAIEAELLAINNILSGLQQADVALDKKISDLQTYVDTQLSSTKNWANATFATLTQYQQIQTEISNIKALIEQVNAGLSALETRLNGKIATDIQTAISSAKNEIATAYTATIATAIKESESGLKTWVNEQLVKGYYDIATIDGKLSALSTRLDKTDSDLQKQITEQQAALGANKEELTKAYKNAIKEAIESNNGVIDAAIAEAVENLESKIETRLTVIDANITNIQKQIANISKDMASINEQIAAIISSLSDLQEVDSELQAVIDNLEAELADLQKTLDSITSTGGESNEALAKEIDDLKALVNALQAKEAELKNQMTTLQTYIDTKLQETADWAEATFATLEQYSALQSEISAIKTLVNKTKSDITEEYTAAIKIAINNSETAMKSWVNTQLAQGYYTISDINGKVSALEALIGDGNASLQKQINDQKAALQQAKTDLTNEYKQYINQAIASGGIIDQAIATQVKKAQDELQSKIDAINERLDALEDRLGKLEEDFVNRIQSLKYIPEFSDGKAKMSDFYKTISLDFLVSPSNQAKAVQNAWETNQDVVTAFLRCTKNPETKAISPAVQLLVTSVVGNADGTLNVTLKEDSANPIDTDFFTGDSDAVVYIQISDGNSDIFSDMVEIKSCIELSVYEDLSPLVNGVYKTANCYIVTKAGSYKFKAYKGNSQELAGSSESAVHPIGVINHAKVLWESFGTEEVPTKGDLINVADYEDGYVVFETPDQYREGNAVIAVRDESGNVLWSWHIWLTDQPEEQVYYNNAGTMMDRNLGATSTTPGDPLTWGLIYQWGRKDPFTDSLGSGTIYVQPSRDNSILQATLFPNHIIGNTDAGDFNLDWFAPSEGKLLWSHSQKTIYDPCPDGWRIPKYDVWKIATNSSVSSMECATIFDGMNLSNKLGADLNIWYPGGQYWSSYSSTRDYAKVFVINCYQGKIVFCDSTYMGPVQHYVRCMKE